MNHEEALRHLRNMMMGVQKAKSNTLEAYYDSTENLDENTEIDDYILDSISPWIMGPRSVLPTLLKMVSGAEKGEPIKGMDFINMMYIATKLEPSIAMCAINYGTGILPDPDYSWATEVWYV